MQNFFELGIHDHEILSTADFRPSEYHKNVFLGPGISSIAMPTTRDVITISFSRELLDLNDFRIDRFWKSSRVPEFNLADNLPAPDDFMMVPAIRSPEYISQNNFKLIPTCHNLFIDIKCKSVTYAIVNGDRALCLTLPHTVIMPFKCDDCPKSEAHCVEALAV